MSLREEIEAGRRNNGGAEGIEVGAALEIGRHAVCVTLDLAGRP